MRKILSVALRLLLLVMLTIPAFAAGEGQCTAVIGGLEEDLWFSKYGNVYTDCTAEKLMGEAGFSYGDLVRVSFLDQSVTMPLMPDYSYVESGSPVMIVKRNEAGVPVGNLSLAVNMGNFAERYGIAKRVEDPSVGWHWETMGDTRIPVLVMLEMEEKGGCLDQYHAHGLSRTNEREDYPHLDDPAFANFRMIRTTGIGEGILYRTSSPIDPELGRNCYADAALESAGVTVIMNLADNLQEAEACEGFGDSYYASQKVIYLDLGVDVSSREFQEGLARGLRFFAENRGVYAIHCTEGKDRAGFAAALLECLMGASAQEVVEDYMTTYFNYYGVEPGTETYEVIVRDNIQKILAAAFAVEDIRTADLVREAEEYLQEIGLEEAEITALRTNLRGEEETESWVWIVALGTMVGLAGILIWRKRNGPR
ncbi:MAG: tyrosine-protein phosphatase [Oscillibacter sp.]|nr:tyrosine-protein phosphatase [Oscillibacter sp.]MBQ2995969.1 tyrosine-protein phosphatase [Oscillibacter sp.]